MKHMRGGQMYTLVQTVDPNAPDGGGGGSDSSALPTYQPTRRG